MKLQDFLITEAVSTSEINFFKKQLTDLYADGSARNKQIDLWVKYSQRFEKLLKSAGVNTKKKNEVIGFCVENFDDLMG